MQNPICLILSILLLSFSLTLTPVFGDGLFEEKLSASFGDRKANLVGVWSGQLGCEIIP